MDNIDVTCCFCGVSLTWEEAIPMTIRPSEDIEEQQFLFCHKKCLNDRLHPSIPRHPDLVD